MFEFKQSLFTNPPVGLGLFPQYKTLYTIKNYFHSEKRHYPLTQLPTIHVSPRIYYQTIVISSYYYWIERTSIFAPKDNEWLY